LERLALPRSVRHVAADQGRGDQQQDDPAPQRVDRDAVPVLARADRLAGGRRRQRRQRESPSCGSLIRVGEYTTPPSGYIALRPPAGFVGRLRSQVRTCSTCSLGRMLLAAWSSIVPRRWSPWERL